MISFDQQRGLFHLRGDKMSYILSLGMDEAPHHLYFGKRIGKVPSFFSDRAPYRRAALVEGQPPDSPSCSREFFHYECPVYGTSDFRFPALAAQDVSTGSSAADLRYEAHAIFKGRAPIPGLPYAAGGETEAETLVVYLRDPLSGLSVSLFYHLYASLDIITRHMAVQNCGDNPFRLSNAMSATVDFEDGIFDLLSADGTTLREFTPCVRRIAPGVTEISSSRGVSSHQHNPNVVLLRCGATQHQGEVYGLSLVYSGNFSLRFELDQYNSLRVQGGINPFGFAWLLEKGERFETPEIVLSYSNEGLNGLSARLHPFVLKHLLRGERGREIRPLLLNTWESCYFSVTAERLTAIGREAEKRGVELLVLDDGWFGRRKAANCSLGDWTADQEKFPDGLTALAAGLPLKLGLWIEPEMVSPNSDLYREHPDWCLHIDGRVRTEWRSQLVLDTGREEVVAYLIGVLDRLLEGGEISYIKWDHNRRLTELGSDALPPERQGEVSHRCLMGTYKILEHLRQTYPHILMENCASGGGRFDYGMLCYFHQGWLSDNTDAVCRLKMQNTASIFFPPVVITAHVSQSPNHQLGRSTPLAFRADVCALFNAGFELDPPALSPAQLEQMSAVSAQFKAFRKTVLQGRFYRLNDDILAADWYGWLTVCDSCAVVAYFRPFCEPESAYWTIPLRGLQADALYRETQTGETLSGSDWEAVGLRPKWREGDFFSAIFILSRINPNKAAT